MVATWLLSTLPFRLSDETLLVWLPSRADVDVDNDDFDTARCFVDGVGAMDAFLDDMSDCLGVSVVNEAETPLGSVEERGEGISQLLLVCGV